MDWSSFKTDACVFNPELGWKIYESGSNEDFYILKIQTGRHARLNNSLPYEECDCLLPFQRRWVLISFNSIDRWLIGKLWTVNSKFPTASISFLTVSSFESRSSKSGMSIDSSIDSQLSWGNSGLKAHTLTVCFRQRHFPLIISN